MAETVSLEMVLRYSQNIQRQTHLNNLDFSSVLAHFVRLVSAAWQADTLAVFIKVIFLFGTLPPMPRARQGAHGKQM